MNGALKILTNNLSGGILPLTDEALQILRVKTSWGKNPSQQAILQRPVQKMHPIMYDDIDEKLIKKQQ